VQGKRSENSVRGNMGPITSWGILEKRKILASAGNEPQITQNILWFHDMFCTFFLWVGKTGIIVLHVAFRLWVRLSEVQITEGARICLFSKTSRLVLEPNQSSVECVCGFSPGDKVARA